MADAQRRYSGIRGKIIASARRSNARDRAEEDEPPIEGRITLWALLWVSKVLR